MINPKGPLPKAFRFAAWLFWSTAISIKIWRNLVAMSSASVADSVRITARAQSESEMNYGQLFELVGSSVATGTAQFYRHLSDHPADAILYFYLIHETMWIVRNLPWRGN
jgi:hypothetical protein